MASTKQRATQKRIAAEAGVGLSTVSLVLSGRGNDLRISPRTQSRVRQVARRLGYRPNSLALGLVGKHTRTVGLLLPSGPFFPQFLMPQDLSYRLHCKGYQTLLVDSLHDPEVILESLAEMAARRVNGIVFHAHYIRFVTPTVCRILNEFPVTILITGELIRNDELHAHIIHRNITPAIHEIVEHFVRIGRRRPMIATTVGPSNDEKIEAFKNALREHGFNTSDEATVFDVPRNDKYGPDYYNRFLEKFETNQLDQRQFDALFCTCDEGALAAINYLAQRGRRVPQDVSVVGMNNSPWAQGTQPPLASISWGYPDSFDNIESRLVKRLENPEIEPGYDDMPLEFIRRESAG